MPILVIALNCERAWQEILAPRLQYPQSGRVPAQAVRAQAAADLVIPPGGSEGLLCAAKPSLIG